VEHGLSQEIQKTWSNVSGQVAFVTQTVELLQKQYAVVEERINNLTTSVAHACASSIVKAQASLSRELGVRGIEMSCGQKQHQQQREQHQT
jgi:prophage DNA circulation protein